ncbi:MAG: CBS domain-containing protein [Aphanocapsa sp. GSE-SYN-MK-11-07L]|jgi:signal-transduction protein with cAMP-binding, CBS, and nucleotidyltransferase domain|nr:CBS domain-containing protein [Aphanocapsa sp. GSE-SYN-MK-11-07L]
MNAVFDHSLNTPPLADAIDRHPLTVAPDAWLSDVVALMNQTAQGSLHSTDPLRGARASCVLVMQGKKLEGIFTERDLVQLTALGVDLQTTKICEVMHHPVLTMSEQSLHDIFAALFLFRRHRIRHLAIADQQQHLIGVVSLDSIRHILRPANLLKIRRVAEVMTNQVVVALPTTPVLELTTLMATHQISCVVIVQVSEQDDSLQQPVGIVTERDIVHFQALGLDIRHTPAQTVMSTPLFVLSPEDSLWTAHQAMEERQVRRLVVSWNWGQNLGIVTQTSILRVFDPIEMHGVIETLQRTLQQLGLNLDQVLATAIDHDTHLPAAFCSLHEGELPNLKTLLTTVQTQIEQLVKHPELSTQVRQTALIDVLFNLQQFQHIL